MTFTVDLNTMLTVLSIMAIMVVWMRSAKARATMEGRHQRELESMREKLDYIEGELEGVKECNNTLDGAVIQIRTDVAWIKDAVAEIKESLAVIGRRNTDL